MEDGVSGFLIWSVKCFASEIVTFANITYLQLAVRLSMQIIIIC